MIQPERATVIFAYPRCTSVYSAIQRPARDFGSFDCWDCRTEIYRWSGAYSYTEWDDITCEPTGIGACCVSHSRPHSS
jgi:hypothetical protein